MTIRHSVVSATLRAMLAYALFGSGCATEPLTGRKQLALLSESEANQLGAQSYQQILSEARVSTNATHNALVQRVGGRIAAITDARMAEEGRETYKWEFKVIDDPKTANAFALPGGKVAVYTGILPITKDDNGLAVVLGHEVAHAYAQHGRKRVSESIVSQLGLSAVEAFLGGERSSESSKLIMACLGVGYQVGVQLKFSRDDESAADHIGIILMAEAGYDPRSAIPFWGRMESAGGERPPEFLSTHPGPETRIQRIQELLPKAMEVYQRSGASTVR